MRSYQITLLAILHSHTLPLPLSHSHTLTKRQTDNILTHEERERERKWDRQRESERDKERQANNTLKHVYRETDSHTGVDLYTDRQYNHRYIFTNRQTRKTLRHTHNLSLSHNLCQTKTKIVIARKLCTLWFNIDSARNSISSVLGSDVLNFQKMVQVIGIELKFEYKVLKGDWDLHNLATLHWSLRM